MDRHDVACTGRIMEKLAITDAPINELIRRRWSPRAFDNRLVEREKLYTLFEAVRWAASSANAQPWQFIVATKDDPENFDRVLQSFNENNQAWAGKAPVIGLSVATLHFPQSANLNRFSFHDVGQAAATLAFQAAELGLQLHQMGGILPEKAREIFSIPSGYEVVAGLAVGYPGDPNSLPEKLREREHAPRQRKPLSEFVFTGRWGTPASLTRPKS
jgi:nitroreductase